MAFKKIEDKEDEFVKNADMKKEVNKGGRPPKKESDKINKQITVRLKESELKELEELAEIEGVSISTLGRKALRKVGYIQINSKKILYNTEDNGDYNVPRKSNQLIKYSYSKC